MDSLYGSIDLTKLGQVVRMHPELVRVVNMKDGTQHKFLNIDINPKQNGADKYGNAAYIKASCKKTDQRAGVPYYLCDLKLSQRNNQGTQQPAQQQAQAQSQNNSDYLPF